jgi:23S rRNA U2552 (ribose-2'-O)-methylase RlmE/FtsJ
MSDWRDPTELLCRVSSLKSQPTQKDLLDIAPRSLSLSSRVLSENIVFSDENAKTDYIYCDGIAYQKLIDARNSLFDELKQTSDWQEKYIRYRNFANPFERVAAAFDNKPLISRAAIKLANIDAVYNVTKHTGAYVRWYTDATIGDPSSPRDTAPVDGVFRFCDIAGGPGGFTQYITWRRPGAIGYGITLISPDKSLNWNVDRLPSDTFTIVNGVDGTGNLFTNSESFVRTVREAIVDGVDLAVADGGFETDEELKEVTTTHLVLSEIMTALGVLRTGGSFVLKTYDTVTQASRDLLLILALCFSRLWIFKPVSSRPANSEQYIIGKGYLGSENAMPYITLLQGINALWNRNPKQKLQRIFDDNVPEFDTWLRQNNDIAIRRQYQQTLLIGALSRNIRNEHQIVSYDIHYANILWNIPDEMRSGKYDLTNFPYQHKFMPSIGIMFENLKKFEPHINTVEYRIVGVDKDALQEVVTVDPSRPGIPLFHLQPSDPFGFVSFSSGRGEYYGFSAISDHFNERARMAAAKDKYDPPLVWWSKQHNRKMIVTKLHEKHQPITAQNLHASLYEHVQEARQFLVSTAKGVLKLLLPQIPGYRPRMLDPSAGWGDRLITAMSLDIEYLGYDPNTALRNGNDQSIALLGQQKYHRVVYQPFETADLSQEKPFDIVFTSPPYFDVERYTTLPGQSNISYPSYDMWIEKFFKPMLLKSWTALRIGGYMVIHIADVRYRSFTLVLRRYMQSIGAMYMGIIGYAGSSLDTATPMFVWLKQ